MHLTGNVVFTRECGFEIRADIAQTNDQFDMQHSCSRLYCAEVDQLTSECPSTVMAGEVGILPTLLHLSLHVSSSSCASIVIEQGPTAPCV